MIQVKQIFQIVKDVVYISKISNTKNKGALIALSVILSQLSAFTDIAIIVVFSALIANQFTNIDAINTLINYILNDIYLVFVFIILKFIFQYFQNTLLKKIELSVNKNLKSYILSEIFNRKNYSVADSFFYINILSTHISFFYSSFAQFVNSLFQITAYSFYLFISDANIILSFLIGILILAYPTKKLLDFARLYMQISYDAGQESNREVQRVVDNLFLIKILGKELDEVKNFDSTLDIYNINTFKNFKFGVLNSFLPTFFTLLVLTSVLVFTEYGKLLTLDFIGVILRLFQSLGQLTGSMNKIINSHVHIEKFYEIEKNTQILKTNNFYIKKGDSIIVEKLNFKYFNSEDYIFKNVNFSLQKDTHTIVTGPNGSGKSTLLGLLAGVYLPTKGSVSTFSKDYAYVGPNPLIFDSTLYENLTYGNNINLEKIEIIRILKNLNTFKEESNYQLDKKISNKNLSSGQMQKIAFARAFLANPSILLLDEAVSNLDEETKNIIFQILKEKKITIINSTHEPEKYSNVDSCITIDILNELRKVNYLKLTK